MLGQEYRDLVFGEARSSNEAAVLVTRQHWDLSILDITIPIRTLSTFSRKSFAGIPPLAFWC